MRQIPREPAGQLESVENLVARVQEIRSEVTISFEQRAQPAAAFVRQRRAECGGSQANQVLETLAPSGVGGEPGPHDQHSSRVYDRVERLILVQPGSDAQRPIKTFSDVLDGDFRW